MPAPPPEYRDAGAYAGGEVGARRVLDADGRAFVFKEQPPGLAPQTTEKLRGLGYPAPRYVTWGDDWCIQEELPGTPYGSWNVPLPPGLLELNELHAGQAVDDDASWPRAATAWDGSYMYVDELEAHSDEARRLVARCRDVVQRHASEIPAARDVVHWDFTASNILVADGDVTGVIDWGGTCSGDRLFDLSTWLYYSPDDALRRYIVERAGEAALAVYTAHMAIRQAGWSVHAHEASEGVAMIRYGLERLSAS